MGLAFLGGAMDLLSSFLNYRGQRQTSMDNYNAQIATNEQNERLMRESWERDDNAVQRRVADLKASGLSPLLAAGSAAGNSGPIQLQSPKQSPASFDFSFMSAMQMAQAMKTAELQDEQIKATTDKINKETELAQLNIDHYGESPEMKNLEYLWNKISPYLDQLPWFKDVADSEPFLTLYDDEEGYRDAVNRESKDKLESSGVDTTPPSLESHPKDFGITNSDLIQDGTYFIEQLRSDGKLTKQNVEMVANTLGKRYNQRKGDIFDWLMSLAGL